MDTVRLDKWLWFARVVKTRTLAQKLIRGSNVRINKTKISRPSVTVAVGDVLTISVHRKILIYKILAGGTKRGSYTIASQLYEDLSPLQTPTDPEAAELRLPRIPKPDKYTRRKLIALKNADKLY